MDPVVGGAAISAASSLASGIISSSGRRHSQKRAYDYNKRLMALQNEYNINNWQLQNEYNDPSNVMARYRRAGLNPYSIAGDGIGSAGAIEPASPIMQMSPDDMNYAEPFGQALANLGNLGNDIISNRNTESKTATEKFKLDYEKAVSDLNKQLKEHQVSREAYNADLDMMNRNFQVFTFTDKMLTSFLQRDYVDRQLKNATAIEIAKGSALEDLLGLKMTENRGWMDDQNPSNFGYGYQHAGRVDADADQGRISTNEYYNFLYRGSKDKNNPIYNYFLNNFQNMYTDSVMQGISVQSAQGIRQNLDAASLIESANRLAEVTFDHSMRNGFKNFNPNMLLYLGVRSLSKLAEGAGSHALSRYVDFKYNENMFNMKGK